VTTFVFDRELGAGFVAAEHIDDWQPGSHRCERPVRDGFRVSRGPAAGAAVRRPAARPQEGVRTS
jgi:hypothetical protein